MRLNHLFSHDSPESWEKSGLNSVSELQSLLDDLNIFIFDEISGAYSGAETHVPFPNTAVKGSSGDGTVHLTTGEQHGAGIFFHDPPDSHCPEDFFYFFSDRKRSKTRKGARFFLRREGYRLGGAFTSFQTGKGARFFRRKLCMVAVPLPLSSGQEVKQEKVFTSFQTGKEVK